MDESLNSLVITLRLSRHRPRLQEKVPKNVGLGKGYLRPASPVNSGDISLFFDAPSCVLGVTSSNVNFDTLIINRRLKPATILSLNLLHPDFPFLHPHSISFPFIFPDGRDHIKCWCRQEEEFLNLKAWPKPPRSADPLYIGRLRQSAARRGNNNRTNLKLWRRLPMLFRPLAGDQGKNN